MSTSRESVSQPKSPSPAKTDEVKPKDASSQNALDCSSVGTKDAKPCTFSRTFQVQEREWWDVSLGVTVPGVRQTQYTADTTVHSKSTTHTNVYAFLDFGLLNTKPRLPHLSVGLPVSGQVFYRPFFGVGQSITTLPFIDRLRFPLKFGVFVGVVYARQQTPRHSALVQRRHQVNSRPILKHAELQSS
jgi:hypothetical protein